MGAKTPDQLNKARPTVKCDVCGRKFVNAQALRSHHKFLHTETEASRRVAFKKQSEAKPIKKKVLPVHMLKRLNSSLQSKQDNSSDSTDKEADLVPTTVIVPKKPEFECPVCAEKFPVYFTAFRHIQKNHCVNENGEKVLPNSPLLIKPIRIEMCASCNKVIRSTEPHSCPKPQSNKDQYFCIGCEQVFNGIILFQLHVKGLHSDGAQNFFFPNRREFTSWMVAIQEQSNTDFVRLNKLKSKEVYHCSHEPTSMSPATQLCPSTIIVREYTKGIHVCYYREHYGHLIKDIKLKQYDQFCISLYTRDTEELSLDFDDDNELYQQFKKIVTCIVFDAAKVDNVTLKGLLGKAFEMTTVMKNAKGIDKDATLISKCLTDTQIVKTLDSLKPNELKRKLSPEPKEIKRVKIAVPTTDEKAVENGVVLRPLRSSVINKSVSFNKNVLKETDTPTKSAQKKSEDTLPKSAQKKSEDALPKSAQKKSEDTPLKSAQKKSEDTLPKSAQKKSEDTLSKSAQKKSEDTPPKSTQTKKKSEEIPQKSSLKKKEEAPKPLPKSVEEIKEKRQEEVVSPATVTRSLVQSPSSFNESYKNFVDQNFKSQTETSTPKPTPRTYSRKKEVVKTKMGQFKVKPSLSPKSVSPKNSPKEVKPVKEKDVQKPALRKNFKAKPDIKYEVKEQENDVNILILKI